MTRDVYWIGGSPFSWRVLLALEVKKLPYTSHLLQASKGEHKAPAFLAINPRGKVPALKDGDTVIAESMAIIAYLDRQYPDPPLFGRDAKAAARIWQTVSESMCYFDGAVARVSTPIFFGKIAQQKDDIRAASETVHGELAKLEAQIAGGKWLAGKEISAADIAVYPFIKGLLRAAAKPDAQPLQLGVLPFESRYPKLAKWLERVEALPGYERTYPPNWRPAAAA
jgi:glutathione S-transferase